MKLDSVSNPVTEPASAPKPAERPESPDAAGAAGGAGPALAVGKSGEPVRRKRALETILGPTDDRTRIRATREAPWRMICALAIDGPWGSVVGTGWLVGPRTIVTAGHCVFDADQLGGWATRITVSPGRNGDERPFGSFVATRFSTTDRWKADRDPDFDMAAIHVEAADALPAAHGWFTVDSLSDAALNDHMVNVSGYPGDKNGGTEQWWARNRIKATTPRRVFYDVDTMPGQSGAPTYIVPSAGAAPVVVGIHAYGVGGTPAALKAELNSAPRIIPEVVKLIDGWKKADGGA